MPGREEFAPLMERRLIVAATRGALTKPLGEASVCCVEHVANMRGALMEPGREEFAPLMERRLIVAATRGAHMEPLWAEFVSLMAQRLNVAATRGAPNFLKREDFV